MINLSTNEVERLGEDSDGVTTFKVGLQVDEEDGEQYQVSVEVECWWSGSRRDALAYSAQDVEWLDYCEDYDEYDDEIREFAEEECRGYTG